VAVQRGHLNVVKVLLEFNADKNQTDYQSNNSLHACAMLNSNRNAEIGELLLENNSDVDKQNFLGFTPLHYCARNDSVELAALLINASTSILNIRDLYGQTALFMACNWKSENVQRLLLKHNANKDIDDSSELSPIHFCARESSEGLLLNLLEFGDDSRTLLKLNSFHFTIFIYFICFLKKS
jgi:ankyrin repeat protein